MTDTKEREEINGNTDSMELELEGHIYVIQKDKEGKVLLREELDGEVCLKVLLSVVNESVNLVVPPELLNPEE